MKIQLFHTVLALQNAATWAILREILHPRGGLLGIATGTTTTPIYEAIASLYRQTPFDTEHLGLCCLDDYVGIPQGHIASCAARVRRQLVEPLGLREEQAVLPISQGMDVPGDAQAYEARIRERSGIGFQVLGLGEDAHIGFCRPGTPFDTWAHAVEIPPDTQRMLHRRYGLDPAHLPGYGITLGLRSIMQARSLLVIAHGKSKASAVAAALQGPITPQVPASVLQLHPSVLWMVDTEAAPQ